MDVADTQRFDVVVVGGGPGGSTAAAMVAMRGHRVLILEKELFPRYQIGESLLPSTVHGVCRLIGVTDELVQAGFVRKRGGTFKWGVNPAPWTFTFSVSRKMAGPTSFAYQVERMKFDKILLDNASRVGAEVRQRCTVIGTIEEDGRVCGVRYVDADGVEHLVRARYVMDASGHQSRIYRSVGGAREYSKFFRNLALFGYFRNGARLPAPNSGNIFCVAFEKGWFWYIPLTSTMTSVGVVIPRELAAEVENDRERTLYKLISECPLIAEFLADAERISDGAYGTVRVRKDYSYRQSQFWCPGMVVVGDAACFVDPVFSSGVHLATYGAMLAGRSLNSAIEGVMEEEVAFREFETRYQHEYRVFYEYLMSFYAMHADEGSYFWQAKQITNDHASELESFVNLVGGVSSDEFDVDGEGGLAMMRQRINAESSELAEAAKEIGESGSDSVAPLLKATVFQQVMQESEKLLARAQLGAGFDTEKPFHPNGVISSPDGLMWVFPARPEES